MAYSACSHPFGSFGYCTIYRYQTLQLKENIRHRSVTRKSHDFPRLYRNQYSATVQHSWLGQGDNSLLYVFFSQFKCCNNHNTGPLDIFIMYIFFFPHQETRFAYSYKFCIKMLGKSHLDSNCSQWLQCRCAFPGPQQPPHPPKQTHTHKGTQTHPPKSYSYAVKGSRTQNA